MDKYYNSDEVLQELINGAKLTNDKFKKGHYIFMEDDTIYDEHYEEQKISLKEFVNTRWKQYKCATWLEALAALLRCQSIMNAKTKEKYQITNNGLCIYDVRQAKWMILNNLEDRIQQFADNEWIIY